VLVVRAWLRSQATRSGSRGNRSLVELATKTEPFDQAPVALDVGLGQVVEQPAALPDQQQQAAPAVVVVLVPLEMFGEVGDATGEHGDLNFRRAGVTLAGGVLSHDLLLGGGIKRHGGFHSGRCAARRGRSTRALTDPRPISRPPQAISAGAIPRIEAARPDVRPFKHRAQPVMIISWTSPAPAVARRSVTPPRGPGR
jgi:hypothetical protein